MLLAMLARPERRVAARRRLQPQQQALFELPIAQMLVARRCYKAVAPGRRTPHLNWSLADVRGTLCGPENKPGFRHIGQISSSVSNRGKVGPIRPGPSKNGLVRQESGRNRVAQGPKRRPAQASPTDPSQPTRRQEETLVWQAGRLVGWLLACSRSKGPLKREPAFPGNPSLARARAPCPGKVKAPLQRELRVRGK
jgi:hypothetical protein